MSRSHFIFRDVPTDEWVDRYEKSHQNPINRVFHKFGIPMIAVSIPLFLIAPLVRGFWEIPLPIRDQSRIGSGKPARSLQRMCRV
jgi:hypothetical protein